MKDEEFTKHSCEQVLRFTQAKNWNELSEERKVQLGFNLGAMSLSLNISKEDGFVMLSNVREGKISMEDFHNHLKAIILSKKIAIDKEKVSRPF